ncbi:MAG: hypothetical protein ACYS9C_20240, partial [Planctomycetota bacterium]
IIDTYTGSWGWFGADDVSISIVQAGQYDFDDGTLQGWNNDVTAGEDMVAWDTSSNNNEGRTVARSGAFMLLETNFDDRDTDTNVKLLSSPQFQVTAGTFVEVWSLGGTGSVATPLWSNYSAVPAVASASGFMGIALRRVSDGEYLLFARRSGPGQSNSVPPGGVGWEAIGWDATTIGAAVAGDSVTETYVVDIIDTYTGDWGWIGADDVFIAHEPDSRNRIRQRGRLFLMSRGPDQSRWLRHCQPIRAVWSITSTVSAEPPTTADGRVVRNIRTPCSTLIFRIPIP